MGAARRRGGAQRVGEEAVAGSIRSDKQALRMGELEMLFAAPVFTDDPEPAPPPIVAVLAAATTAVEIGIAAGASAGPSLAHVGIAAVDPSVANPPGSARMSTGGRPPPIAAKIRVMTARRSSEADGASVAPSDNGSLQPGPQRLSGRKRKAVNYAEMKEDDDDDDDDGMEEDSDDEEDMA